MHEDSTEGEEMKRQQRMKVMKDTRKKIRSKGWMLTTDGGLLSCWRRIARKLGSMVGRMVVLDSCKRSRSPQHGEEERRS